VIFFLQHRFARTFIIEAECVEFGGHDRLRLAVNHVAGAGAMNQMPGIVTGTYGSAEIGHEISRLEAPRAGIYLNAKCRPQVRFARCENQLVCLCVFSPNFSQKGNGRIKAD
jgi:hypothetical protein